MNARIVISLFLALLSYTAMAATPDNNDHKAEVTFLVSMTCQSCQQRIEEKIAFEKGVKKLTVNLEQKTVIIVYDTRKTSPDTLKAAIRKLGYTVKVIRS